MKKDPYAVARRWEPLEPFGKVVAGLVAASGLLALVQVFQIAGTAAPDADVVVPVANLGPQIQGWLGYTGLSNLSSLVSIGAGVCWLIWQYRAHNDLYARALPGLRYTPAWGVIWWFIPLANFVMPALTMRELWDNAGRATGSPRSSGGTWTLFGWWTAYIASSLFALVGIFAVLGALFASISRAATVTGSAPTTVLISTNAIHSAQLGLLWSDVLRVVAAAGAVVLVLSISRRESALGGVTLAPPPPVTVSSHAQIPPRPDL